MPNNRLSKENVLSITQRFLTLAADLKEAQAAERIKPALEQYQQGLFSLVVVGEIKKGKSSFINALLGEPDLLPTMSDVATSTVFKIRYGEEKKYQVLFLPQDIEHPEASTPPPLDIPPDQVADYGTEDGNPGNRKNVDLISVQLPHPWLKMGVEIVDTPGLGGVFREHQYITWRYIPNADALFFVMDSVEAVASRAEMEYLQKLRTMTSLLFFVQTKIDLVDTKTWQQWRDRNRDIIANTLQVPKEKLIYFPVSAELKRYADEDHSPDELDESGFAPLLDFFQNELLKAKEHRFAHTLLQAMAGETADIRRRLGEEQQVFNTQTKEGLDALEREFMETKTRFDRWQATEYQSTVGNFQTKANDLKRETINALQDQLDSSMSGPIVGPLIAAVRRADRDAKAINREAGAIQSQCMDLCTQQIFTLHKQYNQAMNELISATAHRLGQSYTADLSSSVQEVSLPPVESLNMQFSTFENARNALYGGMAGGMMAGLALELAAAIVFPPTLVVTAIASLFGFFGGGYAAKRNMDARRKEEAINKLQTILRDTVQFTQRKTIQQFQNTAIEFERAAGKAFEEAASKIHKELQDKLNTLTEARNRAREDNQRKVSQLQDTLKRIDQLLRDIGQLAGANAQAVAA